MVTASYKIQSIRLEKNKELLDSNTLDLQMDKLWAWEVKNLVKGPQNSTSESVPWSPVPFPLNYDAVYITWKNTSVKLKTK